MKQTRVDKLDAIFESGGQVIRASILSKYKFCSKDIAELIADGYLVKLKTGHYIRQTTMAEISEMELVALLIPQGVISLISAAQYHNMTTINPLVISITIPKDMRTPVLPDHPPISVYKTIRKVYEIGIEVIPMQFAGVKVYDRERTLCDLFRMRLQIGEDVAIEVLKSYMAGAKNLQKLFEYAEILQIKGVLRPYVEALI
ncbi:MAG: hypothetical protein BWY37_00934 [Firmicutes bacterium ADurb.Bin262]|nr:MAG: hypothetical protein BWY37_00934 [Firmicutes bacterium ADurb.Bin262]